MSACLVDKLSHPGMTASLPVASATVIDVGDLVYIDSAGQIVVVSSILTAGLAVGITLGKSANGETDPVAVDMFDGSKVYDMVLAAGAQLEAGELVTYNSDKYIVATADGQGAFGEVAEDMAATGTSVRVRGFSAMIADRARVYARCVTLDGSGTTTVPTYASLNVPDAEGDGSSRIILISKRASHTVEPWVSARGATSFTITHDNGSSAVLDVLISGPEDRT